MSTTVNIDQLKLSEISEQFLAAISLPAELPELTFKNIALTTDSTTNELELSADAEGDWVLDIGIESIEIENISIQIQKTKNDDDELETSGSLGGTVSLGNAEFELTYEFPGEFELEASIPKINLFSVIQDLCGAASVTTLPVPPKVLQAEFNDVTVSVAPMSKSFGLSGETILGKGELQIEKTNTGSWGFIAGFAPPASFKFSAIDDGLAVLNDLNFSNSALIISATRDADLELSVISAPEGGISVSPGLNFYANLDTSGLGVDELMGLNSLSVSAVIGNRPANIVLEAIIDGSFAITETVSFGDMRFRLQPAPSNFAIGIRGAISAKIDDSDLKFIGGMEIRPLERAAAFQAMMAGTWNEPFGFKGVALTDVAADIGITIVPPPSPPLPIIGLAGSLRVGEFAGSAAVKFDSAVPSRSMLAVGFNQLHLQDVIRTFCSPQIFNSIPADLRNTVLDVGMNDVDVYLVPQPTQIVDLFYDAGFTLKGSIQIAGFNAFAHINLDYSTGLLVEAEMDIIEIAGIFKIAGSLDKPKPMMLLDLRSGHTPRLEIAGSVFLLGLHAETRVSLSDTAFFFYANGKIFDLFEATIEARGSNFHQGGDFYLKVDMKNDLFAYLRNEATKAIQTAANEATRELNEAQADLTKAQGEVNKLNRDIDNMRATIKRERERDERRVRDGRKAVESAQAEVNRLNAEIERMRGIIKKERERDSKNVESARRAVTSARNEVNKLNRQINDMRATIQRERKRDSDRIRSAEREVQKAQNSVNSIQGEINSSKRRISTLEGQIASKRRWYDRLPWYKKTYGWAELGAYSTPRAAEISGLYVKIGGLETAKATANGVLEGAKQVLRGIRAAADTFPIDADPRMVGLFTAKETANGVLAAAEATLRQLESTIKNFPIDADVRIAGLFTARTTAQGVLKAAQETLRGLEALIKTFPIDADVRIAGLFTARETANGALELAKLSLEGVKVSVGAMLEVSDFIARVGLGGLLDVRAASFEGQLATLHGGSVKMSATVAFMGQPQKLSFGFNFKSPLSGVEELVKKLLPG